MALFEETYKITVEDPPAKEERAAPPTPESKGGPQQETVSVGETDKIIKLIQNSHRRLYQGVLFDYSDRYGHPLVGYAVPKGGFQPDAMEERISHIRYYVTEKVLPTQGCLCLEDYYVYLFVCPSGAMSVREAVHQKCQISVKDFLLELLRLIRSYRDVVQDQYSILGLCPDTVYVAPRGIYLLPVVCDQGQLPVEIPNGSRDVSADVYGACLLAQEFGSLCLIDEGEIPPKPDNELVCQAMLSCPGWRPGIDELIADLVVCDFQDEPLYPQKAYDRGFHMKATFHQQSDTEDDAPEKPCGGFLTKIKEYIATMIFEEGEDLSQRQTGTRKGGL